MVRFALAGGRMPLAGGSYTAPRSAERARLWRRVEPFNLSVRGLTLVEVMIVLCLVSAASAWGVSAAMQTARLAAETAIRQANLGRIREALELYQSENGRYPATLNDLAVPTLSAPQGVHALLVEIPANPQGTWAYDGAGSVWAVPSSPTGGRPAGWQAVALRVVRTARQLNRQVGLWAGTILQWMWPAVRLLLTLGCALLWGWGNHWAWLAALEGRIRNPAQLEDFVRSTHPALAVSQHTLALVTGCLLTAMNHQALRHAVPLRGAAEQERAARVVSRLYRASRRRAATSLPRGRCIKVMRALSLTNCVLGATFVLLSLLAFPCGVTASLLWALLTLVGMLVNTSGFRRQ